MGTYYEAAIPCPTSCLDTLYDVASSWNILPQNAYIIATDPTTEKRVYFYRLYRE